jgi:hypothetical protein
MLKRKFTGYYQVSFKDIMKGGLHIAPLAGEDALLGNPDRNGIIRPTDLFQETRKIALDIQPRMIVFDTASPEEGETIHYYPGTVTKITTRGIQVKWDDRDEPRLVKGEDIAWMRPLKEQDAA